MGISTKTSNLIFVSVATLSLYYYVCKKVITVLKERGLTEHTCISQTHAGVLIRPESPLSGVSLQSNKDKNRRSQHAN